MRGRQFGFLATLCIIWVVTRVTVRSFQSPPIVASLIVPLLHSQPQPKTKPKPENQPPITRTASLDSPDRAIPENLRRLTATVRQKSAIARHAIPITTPRFQMTAQSVMTSRAIDPASGAITALAAPLYPVIDRTGPASRLNVYAYSFIRGSTNGAIAPVGGQYGGSQSGFIATYDLAKSDTFALLLRGSAAHGSMAERELAIGVRWKPVAAVPLSLIAERRLRHGRADAFAVTVTGGVSDIALSHRFRLDAFAQAGVVAGNNATGFFDLVARTQRKIVTIGPAPVTVGAGLWGGGQKGVFRIDTGPTIGTVIPAGKGAIAVHADWRWRVAGDARPASGPALTLSTSF
jgi:hypothetical protein